MDFDAEFEWEICGVVHIANYAAVCLFSAVDFKSVMWKEKESARIPQWIGETWN